MMQDCVIWGFCVGCRPFEIMWGIEREEREAQKQLFVDDWVRSGKKERNEERRQRTCFKGKRRGKLFTNGRLFAGAEEFGGLLCDTNGDTVLLGTSTKNYCRLRSTT